MSIPEWVNSGTRCRKIPKDGKITRASIVIYGEQFELIYFNYLSGRGDSSYMKIKDFLEKYEPVTK